MKQDSVSNKTISRKKKILIGIMAALVLGAAYFIFVTLTGIYIPCVFRLVTGLKCPGCGVSHMCKDILEAFYNAIVAMFNGGNVGMAFFSKLKTAAAENYFLFFTSPFIIFEIIYSIRCAWVDKSPAKTNEIILYIYLALLIIWGVVRNIIGL